MDEATKKAIEASKSNETNETNETNKTEKNEKIKEVTSTENSQNQITLGKNKVVTIKPWTGKTKKKFKKIFEFVERPEDIDFKQVMKTLLYDHIKEDIYLNEGEQQYLLAEIKKISLNDNFNESINCYNCDNKIHINKKIDEVLKYKENKLPKKYNNIEFVDIKNLESLENEIKQIKESIDYDGLTSDQDVEFAMHIKIKDKTTKEIIEYLDNLAIKDLTDIIKNITEVLPSCSTEIELICPKCQHTDVYDIDITKEIFESLLI